MPSLILSNIASQPLSILSSLLLIEIASAFDVSVAVAGQIRTVASGLTVVVALAVGVLAMRFSHRSLLLSGLGFLLLAAIGAFYSPSFDFLIVSYAFMGIALALIASMNKTIIGESVPPDRRAGAMGLIIAGYAVAYLFGAPTIGWFAGMGGWRFPIIAFVVPITALSLLSSYLFLPKTRAEKSGQSLGALSGGFKQVLYNRSAVSCLLGTMLAQVSFIVVLAFNSSFFREIHGFTLTTASLLSIVTSFSYLLGSVLCGRFSKMIGLKRLVVASSFLVGLSLFAYLNMPSLPASVVVCMFACLSAGTWESASSTLALEQVPEYRGTMMSLNQAFLNAGGLLGVALGGLVLLLVGYWGMGAVLGVFGVLASVMYHFFTKT